MPLTFIPGTYQTVGAGPDGDSGGSTRMMPTPSTLGSTRAPTAAEASRPAAEPELYRLAPTIDAAQARFGKFADTWRERYPAMIETWERPGPCSFRSPRSPSSSARSCTRPMPSSPSMHGRQREAARPVQPDRPDQPLDSILNALTIHYGDRIQGRQLTNHPPA